MPFTLSPRHNPHRNQNLVPTVFGGLGRMEAIKGVSALAFKGPVLLVGELIE